MSSEKVGFAGSSQGLLVGVLERPDHAPLQALAVFAHCFTCGKNSLAATRISRALAQQGIATLRFDFTGLGESEGDFGRGGFSSSVADIVAAVHWMQSTIGMPALLVGHSLGGTAAIAAAWWSGAVPVAGGGLAVVSFEDALVWRRVHESSQCLGAVGSWSKPGEQGT